jgi:hypothetical protein
MENLNFAGFEDSLFYRRGSTHTPYAIFDSKLETIPETIRLIKKLGTLKEAEWSAPVASLSVALQRSGLTEDKLDFFLDFWLSTNQSFQEVTGSHPWHSILMVCPPHSVVGEHKHGTDTVSTLTFCRTIDTENCGQISINGHVIKSVDKSCVLMSNNEAHSFVNGPHWTFFQVFFSSEKISARNVYSSDTDYNLVHST